MIKIIMHAFCDMDDFNAQNLNAREIACRLNPDLFEVTLFYHHCPDKRLCGKPNIHLIKVPESKFKAFFLVLRKLLFGDYHIFFYVRRFRVDHLYFQLKKIFGDKKVTIHTIENPAPCMTSKYYNKRAKNIALSSDYVYSVSKYVAEIVEKNYGIKTTVVYPGVDTQVFKPIKKKLKVLYVGSFQERKRPYLVIEAAKRFPNVEFHLIGKGSLEPSLVKAKTSNVYFHGRVPLEQLVFWMQAADVFLFPSIHEGFSKVTIEAAATGTPCIVFGNYKPETVLNGETGFVVRDIDEMMEKLQVLMEDSGLRKRMGVKAREHAKQFDWNVITKQWEKEFTDRLKHG